MSRSTRVFGGSLLLSIIIVAILVNSGYITEIPVLGQLLNKPGSPGWIAALVFDIILWSIIASIIRYLFALGEARVIHAISSSSALVENETWDKPTATLNELLTSFKSLLLTQRLELLLNRVSDHNRADRALSLLGGRAGLDSAGVQSAYGPLRALVWTLPAFGFMGTALEMASAIGGLGDSLSRTGSYSDLRDRLVSGVVPHLAGAFDLTLFALGGSVVCFLLLSLVSAFEETILLEADAASLQIIAHLKDDQFAQPTSDIQALSRSIVQLNDGIGRLQPVTNLQPLIDQMSALNTTLGAMQQATNLQPLTAQIAALNTALATMQQATNLQPLTAQIAALNEALSQSAQPNNRPLALLLAIHQHLAEIRKILEPEMVIIRRQPVSTNGGTHNV